jgi:hypothetical protein
MKDEITVFFGFQACFGKTLSLFYSIPLPPIHTPCGCKITFQPQWLKSYITPLWLKSNFTTTVVEKYFSATGGGDRG